MRWAWRTKPGLTMPLGEAAHPLWQAADRAQGAGASISELVRWIEQRAGVEIRSPSAAAG